MMAWNPKDPMGGSFGLMQVNGSWLRWLRNHNVIEFKEDLSDPERNLLAANLIWEYAHEKHGRGWSPWGFHRKT
jgi:soluble lytic murein transglycosylase-like protein